MEIKNDRKKGNVDGWPANVELKYRSDGQVETIHTVRCAINGGGDRWNEWTRRG